MKSDEHRSASNKTSPLKIIAFQRLLYLGLSSSSAFICVLWFIRETPRHPRSSWFFCRGESLRRQTAYCQPHTAYLLHIPLQPRPRRLGPQRIIRPSMLRIPPPQFLLHLGIRILPETRQVGRHL